MPRKIAVGVVLGVLAALAVGCAHEKPDARITKTANISLAMKNGRCSATVSDPTIRVKKNEAVEWTVNDQCDREHPQVEHTTTLRNFRYYGPNSWLPWLTPRNAAQASAKTKFGQNDRITYVAIDGDLVKCDGDGPPPDCDYVDYEVYIDGVQSVDPRVVWDR